MIVAKQLRLNTVMVWLLTFASKLEHFQKQNLRKCYR